MKILVLGAGALGSVAGGFLARAGHEVTLVGRAPHMEAINRQGLHITGIWGEHRVLNITAVADISGVPPQNFDLILIAVKSYDTVAAVALVAPLVTADTLVCSYQNGLGNAEAMAAIVGWEHVLGARVIYGARVHEPGRVDVTVIASPTAIGAYPGGPPAKVAERVAAAMNEAGLPTVSTDRIQTVLWSKVAYNCALNPLSALLNVPYGTLATIPHTRAIMQDVVHELYQVAGKLEIPLDPETPHAYLERFYGQMLPPTAAHYASMREDLLRGRPTEIDALNGAIARFGGKCGLSCPANSLLTALIHAREATGNSQ